MQGDEKAGHVHKGAKTNMSSVRKTEKGGIVIKAAALETLVAAIFQAAAARRTRRARSPTT
jgi:hypothetical protein